MYEANKDNVHSGSGANMNNKKRIVFEELKSFGNEMNGRQNR